MIVLLFYLLSVIFVILAPFSKVEESFNMQATHDILYHGRSICQYDHLEFPGVVPRTFVAPLILSFIATPFVLIIDFFQLNKIWSQYIIRLILAGINTFAWNLFRVEIKRRMGAHTGFWFFLISISQFHFTFYLSRLLPNSLALPLVLIALKCWLSGSHCMFIITSGAVILLLRSELMTLFGCLLLYDFVKKRMTVSEFVKMAVPIGITIVCLSTFIDSIFWQRPVWPEAEVFWYNTFLNKSKHWGTLPFLWYFYSALPRALGFSILLIIFYQSKDIRFNLMLIASVVYVLLYSFLPHKELRFIIYVIPVFNVAAAVVSSRLWQNRKKSRFRLLWAYTALIHLFANMFLTLTYIIVSSKNYPGGHAMLYLHQQVSNNTDANVYIGNLAAQTGATRFMESYTNWNYIKSENIENFDSFQYLLVEDEEIRRQPKQPLQELSHKTINMIHCFERIGINWTSTWVFQIILKPCIRVKEKQNKNK